VGLAIGVQFQAGLGFVLLFTTSTSTLEPTRPLIHCVPGGFDPAARGTKIIIIIIIIICLFTAIGLLPGGSGYFTRIQNIKLVTNRLKPGGLHKKHVVATWNVGNRLSVCL